MPCAAGFTATARGTEAAVVQRAHGQKSGCQSGDNHEQAKTEPKPAALIGMGGQGRR